MFRPARWRSEKNRIKVAFKLQFYATQVPHSAVEVLNLAVVPADVGKPTTKLEKAIVRDGCCKWDNPAYETVKFVKEPKSGKINEKIYHFLVSVGSAKGSLIGQASIDFAAYADIIKVSTISLPLQNSKAILHVSIQRLLENVDQREVEGSEDVNVPPKDRSLKAHLRNGEADESINNDQIDGSLNKINNGSELNGISRTSGGSDDVTMSSSESSSGLDTPREYGKRNGTARQDHISRPSSLNNNSNPHKQMANGSAAIFENHRSSQWEWLAESEHGMSTDGSTNSFQDTFAREQLENSSESVDKLKAEIVTLSRQVNVSELELQTLRKQIVKESRRGHDLSREIISLKAERDAIKEECEKLKASHKRVEDTKTKSLRPEGVDPWVLFEEIREELNHEKELNANLRLQLQKTQESNSELILAVNDLEEMLDQKNREISNPPTGPRSCENAGDMCSRSDIDEDEEQKALEELIKGPKDARETHLLEQKITELRNEIEIYKRDKDELEMRMEQLALDYEILNQENHDLSYKLEQSELREQLKFQSEFPASFADMNELETNVENLESELRKKSEDLSASLAAIDELKNHTGNLENELRKRSEEFSGSLATIDELKIHSKDLEDELRKRSEESSDSLATIDELKTHIKILEDELEKQLHVFEADLEAVTCAKVEEEQRAIRAEKALRMTRWKNANTAERLQEEFKRLSMQMASTFDTNEKMAMKALTEAAELRMQKTQLEEMLKKAREDLHSVKGEYEGKLSELSSLVSLKTNQVEEMIAQINSKSDELEFQKKHKEEVEEAFSQQIRTLKAKIENLIEEKTVLSGQGEQRENLKLKLRHMKALHKETEVLLQRRNVERNELVITIALVKKEGLNLFNELQRMKHLKGEKETSLKLLKSELDIVQSHYQELQHSLSAEEVEKENLRKEASCLQAELKRKEDLLTSMEKKLKSTNKFDGGKTTSRNNKSAAVPWGPKEAASLKKKIKLLEEQIKVKETALEASTGSFLEKEKDLEKKINELESRVEQLNQHSSNIFCFNKIGEDAHEVIQDAKSQELKMARYQGDATCTSQETGNSMSSVDREQNLDELLAEVAALKERNDFMENELKEMQERYSEVSLKFAEVEGERQQLVMTVRNLKNSKKS